MKPLRKTDSTSQSCSCTSCIYKSESEQPSIRRYVAHGSRIDRLYYGKYIPLRERKLLDRLVRTRAVYDDLRARLISESTSSMEKNPDLKPRKHKNAIRTLDDTNKSGAILEFVDLIDKGVTLGPKKPSECCSCCSCSSKILTESEKKEHKYRYADEGGYGRRLQKKIGERYNRRGVHFKAKHIRSDPCTCTFKFSGLIKRHSKAIIQKLRPLPREEPFAYLDERALGIVEEPKLKNLAKKSYEKYKESRTRLKQKLEQDIRKVNESKTRMKENLLVQAKKSLEHVKQATDNFKKSLRAEIPVRPEKSVEPYEFSEEETNFGIKKDSIVKFRDHLKRKEMMKDWECDFECEPEECVPEECFKILKLGRYHNRNRGRDRQNLAENKMINREVKIGETPLSRSNTSVQAQKWATNTATGMKKQKARLHAEGGQIAGQRVVFESKRVKKNALKQNLELNQANLHKKMPKSYKPSPKIVSSKEDKVRKIQQGDNMQNKSNNRREKLQSSSKEIRKGHGRQAVRVSSSFSFNVEFNKTTPDSKQFNRPNRPSGIQFTGNKQKRYATGPTYKKKHHHHKGSQVVLKPSSKTSQLGSRTLKRLKMKRFNRNIKLNQANGSHFKSGITQSTAMPFECEPYTCVPGQCDPIACEKRLSNITTNTGYHTKSVSSLTTKSMYAVADKNKNTSVPMNRRDVMLGIPVPSPQTPTINVSKTSQKQAVRIGSTVSFSVEFYKKDNKNEVVPNSKSMEVKQAHKKKYAPRKLIKVKTSSTKSRYIQVKDTLERCFCTLKLHRFRKTKKKVTTFSTGTVTSFVNKRKIIDNVANKYVETERKRVQYSQELLPYECEPGICIPGECNPILCDKIIQLRHGERRTRGSYTGSLKTRSTSSLASRAFKPVKAKAVQSSVVEHRAARRRKENLNKDHKRLPKRNISGKQAVRIGSSFSFEIEFYKDKPGKAIMTPSLITPKIRNIPRTTNRPHSKPKLKEGGYQEGHKTNKSIYTQIKSKNESIGATFQRCFCTLKLYKKRGNKYKAKKKNRPKIVTADAQTMGFIPSVAETVDRGTKTKRKQNYGYQLLPYECEPFTCTPGECDPYLCLERIKRRELDLRDYGVYTNIPKMRSESSFTENPYTRSTVVVAQPKLWGRGTNVKEHHTKELISKYPRRSGVSFANSKQAVKIGSSFSFSVEFSKRRPQEVTLTRQITEKRTKKYRSKALKDRGIKMTKVRPSDINTQAVEAKKLNKSSLVRPMLKRCFCTLNLQKKTRQQHTNQLFTPKMYTVSTAMASNTHKTLRLQQEAKGMNISPVLSKSASSFPLRKCYNSASKYSTLNLCPFIKFPFKFRQPIRINSNFSVEVEFVRKLCSCKNSKSCINRELVTASYKEINEKTYKLENISDTPPIVCKNSITGVRQYLERCFCTMNIQIANAGLPPGKRNRHFNLKPYECEPGVCVPGNCDPYECQKLIMKRLMRNVHKSSGTDTTNRSISSNASQSKSGSRSTQLKSHVRSYSQEFRPKKVRPQQQKRPRENKQRQAVRVGSTFSFDVEFTKSHPQKAGEVVSHDHSIRYRNKRVKHKPHRVSKSTIGAQGSRMPRKERYSQSMSSLVNRGSNSLPMMKRCFCTLKLQKKGRMQREHIKLRHQRAKKELPSITSRDMKVGTPKAKYQNVVQHEPYDLKPYECEPNICVPGQCDPYECLEIMKKRKQMGINTTPYTDKSISSMTSGGGYPRGKHKNFGTDFKPKKMHSKAIKSSNYVKSDNTSRHNVSGRGSRQAVRIGSNFSFNIEFYKGTPHVTNGADKFELVQKTPTSGSRYRKPRKESRGSFSQDSKTVFNRDTQIDRKANQAATMTTSFLKRCFCTAKLRGIENVHHHTGTSPTFMQKCFCLLGLKNKAARENYHPQKLIETADKLTNTNYRPRPSVTPLEPYECEPGICVPGQCDPYVCDKIIQRRLAKQYTKASGTESMKTHSVSSGYGIVKQPTHKRNQAHIYKHDKQITHTSRAIPVKRRSKTGNEKRVVRIGSNFSFNVEFYKEKLNDCRIHDEGKIKTYQTREKPSKIKMTKIALKGTGTESFGPVVRNHEAQVRRQVKSSGVNPILKRCFCTLKLLNKSNYRQKGQVNDNHIHTNDTISKNVETQSPKLKQYKCDPRECEENTDGHQIQKNQRGQVLLPYECEPMTCIPGECNPEECLKRIKRRQRHIKNYGTLTEYPKNRSIGSIAGISRRDQHLQSRYTSSRHKAAQIHRKAPRSYIDKPVLSDSHSRQAVRIGSNFSFNIEFFKDTRNNIGESVDIRPQENIKIKSNIPRSPRYHKKSQLPSYSRDVDSQAFPANTQSTETGMPKRCFCTLQLKNKEVRRHENKSIRTQHGAPYGKYQRKSENSVVGQFLKKCICALKIHKVGKLGQQSLSPTVKYDIKGTSTHKRNPRTDDIRPQLRSLEPYECEPNVCIPGECDPYECLKRIQKRQVRHFGTDYKRNLKDFGTDSIKGPVTKCTESQCIRKNRLKSHGTSLTSKRTWNKERPTKYISHPSQDANRQAVRIGSNFSFNIEFFKEHGQTHIDHNKYATDKIQKLKKAPKQFRTTSRGSDSIGTGLQCRSSQCPYLNRATKSSAAHTLPKRCFCTLQFQKKSPLPKATPPKPVINTEDKTTATKNKYMMNHEMGVYECPPLMCIPGECDPYDCLDKMKRRGLIRKSRNMGTRTKNTAAVSVGNRALNLRTHKVQSNGVGHKSIITSTPRSEPQSQILRSPPILSSGGRQNKNVVRIGSNFNFNVEFFKQKSQPTVIQTPKIVRIKNEEDSMSFLNKNVLAKTANYRHYNSQVEGAKTKSQGSDAGNMLKRCFCTLQLQKSTRQRQNTPHSGIKVRYPQTVTVGRVSVDPYNKCFCNAIVGEKFANTKQAPNSHLKSVSTKIHKQFLQNQDIDKGVCKPNNCQELKKINPVTRKGKNDMQTILPFTPSKFNKKDSKTLVCDKIQPTLHDRNQSEVEGERKLHNTSMFNKGKRLTAKKSKKSIPAIQVVSKLNDDSFLCRCAKLFSRRVNMNGPEHKFVEKNMKRSICKENLKSSESERQPTQIKLTVLPKSRSLKLPYNIEDETCVKECPKAAKNYDIPKKNPKKISKFQSGDMEARSERIKKALPKSDKTNWSCVDINQTQRDEESKHHKLRVTFAENTKRSTIDVPKEKSKRLLNRKSKNTRAILCYSCSENNCPLKSDNTKTLPRKDGVLNFFAKCLKRYNEKPTVQSESADDCRYCNCCKRKIDLDEVGKGAGDRRSVSSKDKLNGNMAICPCDKNGDHQNNKDKISRKEDNKSHNAICPCGKNDGLLNNKEKVTRKKDNRSHIAICTCGKNSNLQNNKEKKTKEEDNKSRIGICPCGKNSDLQTNKEKKTRKEDNRSNKMSQNPPYKQRCCKDKKALFEMKIDSVNYNILNKDEVTKNIGQLSSSKSEPNPDFQPEPRAITHSRACICCKCMQKRNLRKGNISRRKKKKKKRHPGAKITVPAKGSANIGSVMKKLLATRASAKPCICGSKECAKESKRMARTSGKKGSVKKGKGKEPCVCGSTICTTEIKRIKKDLRKKEQFVCKCKETIAKRKADLILKAKRKKDLLRRLKIEEEKEEIRRNKRIKRNKELEKKVKKYKNSSDVFLAADSLIDVTKLGLSTVAGMLRSTAKTIYDPKVAYESLKCKKTDPELVMKRLQRSYTESNAAATARRLKMRCLFMKKVQQVRRKLDEYPITHFIMHMTDRNAKTRKFKRKPQRRVREPLDFECSLYMASLRRRPYLCVYYKCPWFYPHFITMLNVWKQFTDIMLFLLAAVVWSPCILCMEGCRAIMCCFFCTG